jgi:hypothetical protein
MTAAMTAALAVHAAAHAALLAEGFADVRVLDRAAADAVAALRFG